MKDRQITHNHSHTGKSFFGGEPESAVYNQPVKSGVIMDKKKNKKHYGIIWSDGNSFVWCMWKRKKGNTETDLILVSHVMTREIPFWGNFWKILKGNAGHWKKGDMISA